MRRLSKTARGKCGKMDRDKRSSFSNYGNCSSGQRVLGCATSLNERFRREPSIIDMASELSD